MLKIGARGRPSAPTCFVRGRAVALWPSTPLLPASPLLSSRSNTRALELSRSRAERHCSGSLTNKVGADQVTVRNNLALDNAGKEDLKNLARELEDLLEKRQADTCPLRALRTATTHPRAASLCEDSIGQNPMSGQVKIRSLGALGDRLWKLSYIVYTESCLGEKYFLRRTYVVGVSLDHVLASCYRRDAHRRVSRLLVGRSSSGAPRQPIDAIKLPSGAAI